MQIMLVLPVCRNVMSCSNMRRFAVLLALVAMLLPASAVLAKDARVTVNWSGVSTANLSITRMRVGLWPKIRKAVCDSYRRGQYPGNVMKTGGKVIVTFTEIGGTLITNFTVTRDKC
jgi:hypothetical protein